MKHRGYLGSETTLYDNIIVDIYHYPFVQTHGMYTASGKLWPLGDYDVSV